MLATDRILSITHTDARYVDIAKGVLSQFIARAQHQPQTLADRLHPLADYFAGLEASTSLMQPLPSVAGAAKRSSKRKDGQANGDLLSTAQEKEKSRKLSFAVTYYSAMCGIGEAARAASVRGALLEVVQQAMTARCAWPATASTLSLLHQRMPVVSPCRLTHACVPQFGRGSSVRRHAVCR